MKDGDKYVGYIYKITSTASPNKCYIGQTIVTVNRRWIQHKSLAKSGKYQTHLYRAMNKYGQNTFSIVTIDTVTCDSKKELVEGQLMKKSLKRLLINVSSMLNYIIVS